MYLDCFADNNKKEINVCTCTHKKKSNVCTLTVSRSDSERELLADVTVLRDVWLEEQEAQVEERFWARCLLSCLFARWPGWLLPAAFRMIM